MAELPQPPDPPDWISERPPRGGQAPAQFLRADLLNLLQVDESDRVVRLADQQVVVHVVKLTHRLHYKRCSLSNFLALNRDLAKRSFYRRRVTDISSCRSSSDHETVVAGGIILNKRCLARCSEQTGEPYDQ